MRLKRYLEPTYVLAIFAFLLPWQTRYIFGWSYLSGTPTEFATLSLYASQVILVFGLMAAYAVHGLPKIRQQYYFPLALGSVIYLITLVSSYLAHWSVAAFTGLLELLFAAIFFAALLDERVRVKEVMKGFVFGLLVPVVLGIYQVMTGGSGASAIFGLATRDAERTGDAVVIIDGARWLRAYGPFPHPNILGGYLAVALAGLAFGSPFIKWRGLAGGLVIVLTLGLLLALSRSALLGLALGLVLAVIVLRAPSTNLARRVVIPLAALVIGVTLVFSLFAPEVVAKVRGGGRLEDLSLNERKEQYLAWPSTMHGIDWIIGNGPRNYAFALAQEHPQKSVWDYQPIHNVPLLILSEIGLLGLLMVCAWSSSIDKINFSRFPKREAVAAFAMGNVVLVILFFDHYIWSFWSGLALIAYIMALTLRLGEDSVTLPDRRNNGHRVQNR